MTAHSSDTGPDAIRRSQILRASPAEAWREADAWLARTTPGTPEAWAARNWRAHAAFYQLQFNAALSDVESVATEASAAGNALLEGEALLIQGKIHGRCDRPGPAFAALARARVLMEQAGDSRGLLEVHQTIANVHNSLGESELAAESLARSLEIARSLDDRVAIARQLNNLATIEQRFGRYDQARTYLNESIRISVEVNDRVGLSLCRFNLAEVQRAAGIVPGLVAQYEAVYAEEKSLGNPFMMAAALRGLAESLLMEGQVDRAEQCWRQALHLFENVPIPGYEARLRIDYARFLITQRQNLPAAEAQLIESDRLQVIAPSNETRSDWLEVQALLRERQGRPTEALALYRELRRTDAALQAEQGRRRLEVLSILHGVAETARRAEIARRHGEELAAALAQAESLRQTAEAANRFKSDMLRMAAHDVRAPLNAVIGFLSLAREDLGAIPGIPTEPLSWLADAEASAHRAIRTLSRLLDTALQEGTRLPLVPDSFDPVTWVSDLLREIRLSAAAKHQTLRLAGTVNRHLVADRVLLTEALHNLIGNAIKFGPVGQIVTVTLRESPAHLTIEVTDQGPGLPPSERDHLFQPFFRGSARPTGGEDSTGLGLALARSLVEAHGGTIGADSLPQKGAMFWMRIPWTCARAETSEATATAG